MTLWFLKLFILLVLRILCPFPLSLFISFEVFPSQLYNTDINFKKYLLFIWLCQVFFAAHDIFVAAYGI